MRLDRAQVGNYLKTFDLKPLFIQALGWDHHTQTLEVAVDGSTFALNALAHKRGMVAFVCAPQPDGHVPNYPTRRKIERKVAKSVHEHLIVYTDRAKTQQVWQWVKREVGKPDACRDHSYFRGQSGEALIQKLEALGFAIEDEEALTLVQVTGRARTAFDVDHVTKRFYDRFKAEHAAFLKFLKGIPDEEMQAWYVSVMLNRLMFIYFIQKKGFLAGDQDYLRNKLAQCALKGRNRYYADFLCPLFFDGFAKKPNERPEAAKKLLGDVPYLNGGIFQPHQIEQLYGKTIQLPDAAFEQIFAFFDAYQWRLDERPLRNDKEINPDVLGYVFEKYTNQKQMGAYYTKEDITGYIGKNTIIPYLFDAARQKCKVAFEGEHSVWRLLQADPDRYIYEPVRRGVIGEKGNVIPESALPDFVQKGMSDPKARMFEKRYNLGEAHILDAEGKNLALPTETWREYVERRKRCLELRERLRKGEVRDINDLITYNLNIRQFAQDVIENCEGPDLLRALWEVIVQITILDPTCGSGAFLFAALIILEPLYDACLDRMAAFLEEWHVAPLQHAVIASGEAAKQSHRVAQPPSAVTGSKHPIYSKLFGDVLARMEKHPNRRYFILKSIIVDNLYGVDIMEEATEICKLRLFLKLVAQVDDVDKLEPLPDIDFNIRAGNTLVGFVTRNHVKQSIEREVGGQKKLVFGEESKTLQRIDEDAEIADRAFQKFREMQTEQEMDARHFAQAKQDLQRRLGKLEDELNRYLAGEYGVKLDSDSIRNPQSPFRNWLHSHQPFHWFVEFYGILKQGGFDVIIGNPPYVEYRLVSDTYKLQQGRYRCEAAGNLYAFCMERSCTLLRKSGGFGMIVPTAVLGLDETVSLREVLLARFAKNLCSTYSIRPSKLFDGVDQRLCIYLANGAQDPDHPIHTSKYHHWNTEERPVLLSRLQYAQSFIYERLNRIPQVGSSNSAAVLAKLRAKERTPVVQYYSKVESGFLMHYHRSPRYWIRAMDFDQYFESPTRTRSIHHFRDLHFRHEMEAKTIGALLNSSLFFFWFVSVGNGRNITGTDVEQFPIGGLGKEVQTRLPRIFDRLMKDYRRNSFIRERQDCKFQEFRPSMSKPIMDEIDCLLASHYGFTDEELDFIINYDIKYRMGREAEEAEE